MTLKTTQSVPEITPKNRADYLNFQIEKIWEEMEGISRSKKSALDLSSMFRN